MFVRKLFIIAYSGIGIVNSWSGVAINYISIAFTIIVIVDLRVISYS